MSAVWGAVHICAQELSSTEALRITNLSIAAASWHASATRRKVGWNGDTARSRVLELAQSPLKGISRDMRLWEKLAETANEAAHLGLSPEGMHAWAAAYQRASTTQKALGAYATHNAFASALTRITMGPLERGRAYRIVDPSVGAGNLLLAAIELYGRGGTDAELKKFILSLHGVELDARARELCCLLIWLAGARCSVTLDQVAKNIRLSNALTLNWWTDQDLFEVLLMNPPWESLRQKVEDDQGGERAATVHRLTVLSPGSPDLPPLFSAQGTGDRNLFKAFLEMAPHLVVDGGRLGALLPSAFASDAGLSELRQRYLSQFEIARWTSFENRGGYFPIDSRYKFGLLAATRSKVGTRSFSVRGFAIEPDEVDAPHIALLRRDIELIGRKYHIIPELSKTKELEILRIALRQGTLLFEPGSCGRVVYRREVDLSLGKSEFSHFESKKLANRGDASFVDELGETYVPLLEGRTVGAFDCLQKTWVSGGGRTAVWAENEAQPLGSCRPQYVTRPVSNLPPRVALCDVTSSTNTRTVVATLVPKTWRCGNTAPVLIFENEVYSFAGLGILNSMVFDWIARRLTSGLHLNKFILEGLVWPSLTESEVLEVAHAAWSICVSMPRSGLPKSHMSAPPWVTLDANGAHPPLLPIRAAAMIEIAVAKGLGLAEEHLSAIYDDDRADRRGFWRYFGSNSDAKTVVSEVLGRYQAI